MTTSGLFEHARLAILTYMTKLILYVLLSTVVLSRAKARLESARAYISKKLECRLGSSPARMMDGSARMMKSSAPLKNFG